MAKKENTHDAIMVKMSVLPFYKSMRIVQKNTGLSDDELLLNNAGFRADPRRCGCGHEWSAFDIVINAVKQKKHKWDFFKKALVGETGGFFYRKMNLTCHCQVTTTGVGVYYRYTLSKVMGWAYKDR